jgi:hypothetical protein
MEKASMDTRGVLMQELITKCFVTRPILIKMSMDDDKMMLHLTITQTKKQYVLNGRM